MSGLTPIRLVPSLVSLDSEEFDQICRWPFVDENAYVIRLLRNDVRQYVQNYGGRIWVYREPGGMLAGFGTLTFSDVCSKLNGGRRHVYIPLLGVNPTTKSLGYGTSILRHLVEEAALLCLDTGGYFDVLFLDVYASNVKAIALYERCGFQNLTDEPLRDTEENDRPYIIMARRISTATTDRDF